MARMHEVYKPGKQAGQEETSRQLPWKKLGLAVPAAFLLILLLSRPGSNLPAYRSAALIPLAEDRSNGTLFMGRSPANLAIRPRTARLPDAVASVNSSLQMKHYRALDSDEHAAVNRYGYVLYRKVGKHIDAFDSSGSSRFRFETVTYPRLPRNSRTSLLFTGDQAGIAFLDAKGRMIGPFQYFTTIISGYAWSDKDSSAYIGLLDGTVEKFFPKSGKTLWRQSPPASRINLVKGVALSPDEEIIALVANIDPERFCVYSRNGELLWSLKSGGDLRTRVYVGAGQAFILGHSRDRVYILDRDNGDLVHIARSSGDSGRITFCDFSNPHQRGPVLFSYSRNGISTVRLLSEKGRLLFEKVYNAPYAMVDLDRRGRSFTVQTDTEIIVYQTFTPYTPGT